MTSEDGSFLSRETPKIDARTLHFLLLKAGMLVLVSNWSVHPADDGKVVVEAWIGLSTRESKLLAGWKTEEKPTQGRGRNGESDWYQQYMIEVKREKVKRAKQFTGWTVEENGVTVALALANKKKSADQSDAEVVGLLG